MPAEPPHWPRSPEAVAVVRELGRGERLFSQGEPCSGLHSVESGVIGMRRVDQNGNAGLVRVALPGDLLGHQALAAGSAHSATAEALTSCCVRSLSAGAATRWLESSAEARAALLEQLAEDLDRAEDRQLVLEHWPVLARLRWALGRLADPLAEGNELELPLSRQDLASWIGARPESLARAIRVLEQQDIAHFSGRHVRIDRAALAAVNHDLDLDQEPAGGKSAQ